MNIAVITPYFKEDAALLDRCVRSVRAQTTACDHFMVSDGHPQQWIDVLPVRHITLGQSHGDYGNTPRGIGAQIAVSEGYDAICFLDADNWLDPTHVQSCLDSAVARYGDWLECDYVVARRRLRRPDLSIMELGDEPDHVDTNCFFFLPGSYFLLPYWNLMPREFSNIGDRMFYRKLSSYDLQFAVNEDITVNYLTLWSDKFRALGETPPAGAKLLDPMEGFGLYSRRTERSKVIAQRLLGLKIEKKS